MFYWDEMLFWEFILESSLLVLMVLGIRKIFSGKIRYAGIYALWLLVLLRFLVPVNIISTPFSAGTLISKTFSAREAERKYDSELAVKQTVNGEITQDDSGALGKYEAGALDGEFKKSGNAALQNGNGVQNSGEGQQGTDIYIVLTGVRMAISGLLLLWFILSNARLMRGLRKNRVPYGERGKVKIYAAGGIQNPCLYGFFHPAIYLPERLFSGDGSIEDAEEMEQIITHEYVHYCHFDHIWAMFRVLLISVYWFDPLLWLAVSCSKKDAELFCDETVIQRIGREKRFSYGQMLIRLAGRPGWGEFRYPIMPMSRKGKEMERRIRAISGRKKYSRWVIAPLIVLVLAAAGITCSAGRGVSVGALAGSSAESSAGEEQKETRAGRGVSEEGSAAGLLSENGGAAEYERTGGESTAAADLKAKDGLGADNGSGAENGLGAGNGLGAENGLGAGNGFGADNGSGVENGLGAGNGLGAENGLGTGNGLGVDNSSGAENGARQQQIPVDEMSQQSQAEDMGAVEELFQTYIRLFTEAVNTGNIEQLSQVLYTGSDVYGQQCEMAKNYFKRGIREKVWACSITSAEEASGEQVSRQVAISSKERYRVYYADAEAKTVRQKYRYTCECIEGRWMITGMDEIN